MPIMNGLQVVQELKKFYAQQRKPLGKATILEEPLYIFLTAYAQNEAFLKHSKAEGVDHVFEKPLKPDQLRQMLAYLKRERKK